MYVLVISSLLTTLRGKDITKRRRTRRKIGTGVIETKNERRKRKQTAAEKERKTENVRRRKKGTTERRTETGKGTEIETGTRTGTRRERRIGNLKKPRRSPRNLRIRC